MKPATGHAIINKSGSVVYATVWAAKITKELFVEWVMGNSWDDQKKLGYRCIKVNLTPKP
jgi:hypothetical protein